MTPKAAVVLAAVLSVCLLQAPCAIATEEASPPPPATPCRDSATARQFDFWIGEFVVRDADGKVLGENSIREAQGGCVLLEQWSGASGGTGMSMNFYDPVQDRWRQLWVSPGLIVDIAGGLVDGSMVLEGHAYYQATGELRPFRGTWTPLDNGVVRQFFEESTDGGRTFVPWFEGFYHPVPAEAPPAT